MAVDDRRRGRAPSLQVSAWRGQRHVAVLTPAPDRPAPDAAAVRATLDDLRARGTQEVVTGALHTREVPAFLAAGFGVQERLHLLRHDLGRIPEPGPHRLRRPRRTDRRSLVAVDNLAFDDFWALDEPGLQEAAAATPAARVRVLGAPGSVIAYAITGRAGGRGYLQRLAVHPQHQRTGAGTSLVADALGWLRRRGATEALVNTQEANTAALALYRHLGFVPEPEGLTVLRLRLGGPEGR
jgi:ribosomal-protein-alanine N-acetyltransferase